jgi:hypothetical protein
MVMPAITMRVGHGAAALAHTENVPGETIAHIARVFAAHGEAEIMSEPLLKEAVAANGCSPGYAYYLIDAVANAVADAASDADADTVGDISDIVNNIMDSVGDAGDAKDAGDTADAGGININDSGGAGDTGGGADKKPDVGDLMPAAVDDVQDKIRQLFNSEGPETASIDVGMSAFAEGGPDLDERDTPFDLPDHVLTSTLADIYYQQGQPQLALHIYERLALRNPDDRRLQAKIEEIKDVLLEADSGGGGEAPAVKAESAEKPEKAPSGRKKKGAGTKDDRRPLAGVKIKKKDGGPKKSARGKS